jgi:DNA-binding GntR family transcriptional regulator
MMLTVVNMSAQIGPSSTPKLIKHNLAELLRQEIIAGRLLPGERIPEGKWAARFKVAQASVREAIHILSEEGFVTKQAGRSARVTHFSETDIARIYAVRSVLEGLAARLVAEQEQDLAPLQQAVNGMYEAVEEGNLDSLIDCDLAFHLRLCELSGNPILLEHLRRLLVPLFAFVRMRAHVSGQTVEAWSRDIPSHRQVVDLLRDRLPGAAEQYMQGAIARYAETAHAIWENQIPPSVGKKVSSRKSRKALPQA